MRGSGEGVALENDVYSVGDISLVSAPCPCGDIHPHHDVPARWVPSGGELRVPLRTFASRVGVPQKFVQKVCVVQPQGVVAYSDIVNALIFHPVALLGMSYSARRMSRSVRVLEVWKRLHQGQVDVACRDTRHSERACAGGAERLLSVPAPLVSWDIAGQRNFELGTVRANVVSETLSHSPDSVCASGACRDACVPVTGRSPVGQRGHLGVIEGGVAVAFPCLMLDTLLGYEPSPHRHQECVDIAGGGQGTWCSPAHVAYHLCVKKKPADVPLYTNRDAFAKVANVARNTAELCVLMDNPDPAQLPARVVGGKRKKTKKKTRLSASVVPQYPHSHTQTHTNLNQGDTPESSTHQSGDSIHGEGATDQVEHIVGVRSPVTMTHAHFGPTNSGKTYDALHDLASHGSGVYAGPLRMLAREAYVALRNIVDDPAMVGLITGEEHINADAPIIAATVEAAPLSGDVLILDETHWLSDPQRGWAWTRLLVQGEYKTMHIIGDAASEQLVRSLMRDSKTLTATHHTRFTPLTYGGSLPLSHMPPRTAVVAFSRKAVLALAQYYNDRGRPAAVLYGSLPPEARIAQIDRLTSGEVDIICCTDVIGHGINLPLDAVALTDTTKFDGTQRRSLLVWETAQILGRAGRRGHSEKGLVYTPTGLPWISADKNLIKQGTQAAAGTIGTGWKTTHAQLRPAFNDLHAETGEELIYSLMQWKHKVTPLLRTYPLRSANVHTIIENLHLIMTVNDNAGAALPARLLWALATCPVDDITLIRAATSAVLGNPHPLEPYLRAARITPRTTLLEAERTSAVARDLRAVLVSTGNLPTLTTHQAQEWEQQASATITHLLTETPHTYGTCSSCHRTCPPWFDTCRSCYATQRIPYNNNYYYY